MGMLLQSDLFDVESVSKCNKDLKKNQSQKIKKYDDLKYIENPKDDNERLLNYQFLFLKNDDKNAWKNLFLLSTEVAKRITVKAIREKHLPVDPIDIPEKVSIAVEYVLSRYAKKNGWYVKKNYLSAIKSGVIHALYYCTTIERLTDYGLDDRLDL